MAGRVELPERNHFEIIGGIQRRVEYTENIQRITERDRIVCTRLL